MLDTSPKRLLDLLVQLDMTNKRLAYLAGVEPGSVSRWVHGHSPVPHSVIRMLELMQAATQGTSVLKAMIPGDPDEMNPTNREVESAT